jgi:polar amino acid transport system substrate-binding protein
LPARRAATATQAGGGAAFDCRLGRSLGSDPSPGSRWGPIITDRETMTRMRKLLLALALVAVPFAFAACGSSGSSTTSASSAANCTKAALALKTPGTLTIGTDNPAFPPWFGGGEKTKPWKGNDPSSGQGYESAVAYAIATKLGLSAADVKWVVVPFDKAIAPGSKDFDILLNQVGIKPDRAKAVDFSTGYLDVNQAVVGRADKPIAKATSVADLKRYKLGASVGSTSLAAINEVVKPDTPAAVYDTNDDAVSALKAGQIDGIVVDLPTGYFVTAAQVEGSKIVGQFAGSSPERLGVVLEKGSALTPCISNAVDALRTDGTLKALEQQWLAGAAAPFLK